MSLNVLCYHSVRRSHHHTVAAPPEPQVLSLWSSPHKVWRPWPKAQNHTWMRQTGGAVAVRPGDYLSKPLWSLGFLLKNQPRLWGLAFIWTCSFQYYFFSLYIPCFNNNVTCASSPLLLFSLFGELFLCLRQLHYIEPASLELVYVDQAGLEHTDVPASAFPGMRSKACISTPCLWRIDFLVPSIWCSVYFLHLDGHLFP